MKSPKLLLPVLFFLALAPALQADWITTAGGVYEYEDTTNWAGGIVDGQFVSTLSGNQQIQFTADTSVTNLTYATSGTVNIPTVTFESDSGTRTLTLNGTTRFVPWVNVSGAVGPRLQFDSNLNITLAGASPTIVSEYSGNQNSRLGFDGVVSGTSGLVTGGNGLIGLTGNNTLSGPINIQAGQVLLTGANGALANATSITLSAGGKLELGNSQVNNNRLSDTATVNLNGGVNNLPGFEVNGNNIRGNFLISGNDLINVTETIGTINLQSGLSRVSARVFNTGPTHGNTTLTSASLTRDVGSAVVFAGGNSNQGGNTATELGGYLNNGVGAQSFIKFTTAPTLTNGILPYAIVGNDNVVYNATGEFATYDATNGIVAFSRTGTYATDIATSASTENVRYLNFNVNLTLTGTVTANSLTLQGNGGNEINGGTIRLTSGALLSEIAGTSNRIQMNSNLDFNNVEAFIFSPGNSPLQIQGNLTNIGSAGINYVGNAAVSGASEEQGIIHLNNSSINYTNDSRVLIGTLSVQGGNPLVNSNVTVAQGATLALPTNANRGLGALSGAGTVRLSATTTGATTSILTVGSKNTDTTFSGNIHAGDLTGAAVGFANTAVTGGNLLKTGTGGLTLSGLSSYSGTTTVSQGTLIAGGDAASTTVYGSAITADNTTDVLTLGAGSLANGNVVYFSAATVPGGLLADQPYYVRDISGSNFKVSQFAGGPAVDITSNGATVTAVRPGVFGSTNSAVVLGDASTASNTVSLLNGGAFTNERDITVANQGNGTTIGGNTADTSNYTGTITLSKAVNLTAAASGTVNFNTTGSGKITGAFGVTKVGNGTAVLGGANDYTGDTTITAGTLLINGSTVGASAFSVSSGATLGGSGTIGGTVLVLSGGTLAPGNSPGNLIVNNSVTISDSATMSIEINGATVGTQYDRVTMTTGTFSLTGTNNLALSLGYTPVLNTLFFLVDNQGANAISGVFEELNGVTTDLSQGADFTVSSQQFRISYEADVTNGTFLGGNDIALQAIPEPSTGALLALSFTTVMLLRRLRVKKANSSPIERE